MLPIRYWIFAVIPLVLYSFLGLNQISNLNIKRFAKGLLVAISLLLWLNSQPNRAFDLWANWKSLDYAPVQGFVAKNIKSTDWVIADFIPYYAAKQCAEVTMYTFYTKAMTGSEKEKISSLILEEDKAAKIIEELGGDWHKTENKLVIETKLPFEQNSDKVEFFVYRKLMNTSFGNPKDVRHWTVNG